jgi:hypothetical protein
LQRIVQRKKAEVVQVPLHEGAPWRGWRFCYCRSRSRFDFAICAATECW